MKNLQRLCILLTGSIILFSCQKEYSVEHPQGINPAAQWSFSEGGVQFRGPIDTVTIDTVGNIGDPNTVIILSMSGHSDDKRDLINLDILGPQLKVGTYKIPNSLFAYSRSGILAYQTNMTDIDSFSIVVSRLDSSGISGTFSGKAYDSAKARRSIVNGVFSAVFKSAAPVPPPSTDSGTVVLWSKAGCGGGTSTAAIGIKLNGKDGQITKFSATEPSSCDSSKGFSMKLPAGTYPWVAKCGVDSVSGTVTVTKNGCTKVLVDFTAPSTDYFPITSNSNWTYIKENSSQDDTVRVTSTGSLKSINANAYSIFTNDYSGVYMDSGYYRKGGGIYYESYPTDGTAGVSAGLEHVFLKDAVAAGTTWTQSFSSHLQIQTTGGGTKDTVITGMINDTLTQRLTTYSVGGNAFNDVLEVHTGTYVTGPLGLKLLAYYNKQWFAKGVGSIKYYQFDATVNPSQEYTIDITRYKVY